MALRHKKVAAVEDSINQSFQNLSDKELFEFSDFDEGAAIAANKKQMAPYEGNVICSPYSRQLKKRKNCL